MRLLEEPSAEEFETCIFPLRARYYERLCMLAAMHNLSPAEALNQAVSLWAQLGEIGLIGITVDITIDTGEPMPEEEIRQRFPWWQRIWWRIRKVVPVYPPTVARLRLPGDGTAAVLDATITKILGE